MPHFSQSVLESDAEGLARLRDVLHPRSERAQSGRTSAGRTNAGRAVHATPSLEDRFGGRAAGDIRAVRPIPEDAAPR